MKGHVPWAASTPLSVVILSCSGRVEWLICNCFEYAVCLFWLLFWFVVNVLTKWPSAPPFWWIRHIRLRQHPHLIDNVRFTWWGENTCPPAAGAKYAADVAAPLKHYTGDVRAAAATALGEMGDEGHAHFIESHCLPAGRCWIGLINTLSSYPSSDLESVRKTTLRVKPCLHKWTWACSHQISFKIN